MLLLLPMNDNLDNYRQLLARVDALCLEIGSILQGQITCSEGCSSCCTSITIFPVEAAALQAALAALPTEAAATIRRHVEEHADGERCPLLSRHRCLLYDARPVICRTHGLPIIFAADNGKQVDCCPLNLSESESLPGTAIIDLDRLNSVLVAVNALYLTQCDAPDDTPERLTIAEAILGFPRK